MSSPNYMKMLEREVLWDRKLPKQVFSRKPTASLFFDGGLLEIDNFLEEIVGWSGGAFAEGDAVLAICSREGGRLVDSELFGLSGRSLSRDCGAAKHYWLSQMGVGFERTCVLFNKGMDWMLYEEQLEDIGVFALFTERRSVTHGPEWLSLLQHFFTKVDINSALATRQRRSLSAIYTEDFLTELMTNY
jgi:hypothetical protein